jgi:hypothetical protein
MTVEAAIAVTTMYDTIGRDAGNIPAAAAKAAGYVTGTLDIVWSDSAWGRLTVAGKVKVDQSELGNVYAAGLANVYDVEKYAGTPGRFAQAAAERHNRGELNCVYGSRTTLEQIVPALKAVPGMDAGWWGGTCCWLADWSLSLAEASRLVGTSMFGGLHVVAVQWATPTSNPDVGLVPGQGHPGALADPGPQPRQIGPGRWRPAGQADRGAHMTAKIRQGLNISGGIREADQDHPTWWAAVRVEPDGEGEAVILEAGTAAGFGMELIIQAAAHPGKLIAPEILTMPPHTGMSTESAQRLGLQLVIRATRAAYDLAVWELLDAMGLTARDKDRFLTGITDRIRST